jgi:hypothetical protein
MLSAVILTMHSYSAFTDGTITDTLAACLSRSSRTKERSLAILSRSRRIWTELSRDVLNPAHVLL